MTKRIQAPPTLAMRLNEADKAALRELSALFGKSQTETVRVLVREKLESLAIKAQPPARRAGGSKGGKDYVHTQFITK